MDEVKSFALILAEDIGEMIAQVTNNQDINCVLSRGNYRIYEVEKEPNLTDLTHLELFIGEGHWQGYLLPNSMPENERKKARIIPTEEVITRSSI
ncbi:MAG: hypothetical protein KBC00_02215 [Candidatus Levybacteria bacterium]|nr:hypothetical protein [Candidatus Levybacteria bacterium]MBP9815094.1 hypothetical protein [Candidatus Levybacteria bacterium]